MAEPLGLRRRRLPPPVRVDFVVEERAPEDALTPLEAAVPFEDGLVPPEAVRLLAVCLPLDWELFGLLSLTLVGRGYSSTPAPPPASRVALFTG